jgi:hypothetical protein
MGGLFADGDFNWLGGGRSSGQWPVVGGQLRQGRAVGEFFVQHFSIFPRFLRCEWVWVSPTLEGVFLLFAKLGEVGGKFFATKVEISRCSFLLGMFRIGQAVGGGFFE